MGVLNRWTLCLGILFIEGCSSPTQPPDSPQPANENTQRAVAAQERGDSAQ